MANEIAPEERAGGASRRVVFHVGAHKTASTHLQSRLLGIEAQLRAAGVGLATLNSTRRQALSGPDLKRAEAKGWTKSVLMVHAAAAPVVSAFDRAVVSDENLIGVPREVVRSGKLYPRAKPKMTLLSRRFAETAPLIAFSLRSYDSFLESVYCEQMLFGPAPPFAEIAETLYELPRSWLDVVADIVEVFGAEALRLWCYESYKRHADVILRGVVEAPVTEGAAAAAGPERVRPSAAAVAEILALPGELVGEPRRERCREILAAYPQPEHPPFAGWSAAQRADLRARYARDVAALRRLYPQAWLVEPPESDELKMGS